MARERGVFNFSGNLEVKKEAPLDARRYISEVATFEDLLNPATWTDDDGNVWLHNTLVAGVGKGETAALYMITDKTKYTQASAWKKITTGGDIPEVESDVYMIGDLSAIDADSAATITAAQIQEMLGTVSAVEEAVAAGKLFVGKYNGVIMAFNVYTSSNNVQLVGQAFTDLLSMTFKKASSTAWQQGVIFSQKSAVTEDVMQAIDNVYILPGFLYSLNQNSTDEEIKEAIGDFDKLAAAITSGKIIAARDANERTSPYVISAYYVTTQELIYIGYGLFCYDGKRSLKRILIHKDAKDSTLSVDFAEEEDLYVSKSDYDSKIRNIDSQLEALQDKAANVYTKTQTDAKIDEKIGQKVAGVYTAKGSYPNLSDALGLPTVQNGWVFSIENEFELLGKTYPAGTNIAYVGNTANQASVETNWDALGGSFDMGEIEQSISEGDTSTLNSAKTYADTQDADFLAQAKTYAQSLFQWHDVGE